MKKVFTTSTGLRIGCMYQPTTKPHHDADALKLQSAYLGDKPETDLDGWLIIIGCAFLMASPYLIMAWRNA
jgi:hypothetical protein